MPKPNDTSPRKKNVAMTRAGPLTFIQLVPDLEKCRPGPSDGRSCPRRGTRGSKSRVCRVWAVQTPL
jgi:hypothetical protein